MQRLFTHIRNSVFHACDDGAEYQEAEVALMQGVRSAAALMVDEINRGRTSAAIEVSIEKEDGTPILCSIVAVSVSRLALKAQAQGQERWSPEVADSETPP